MLLKAFWRHLSNIKQRVISRTVFNITGCISVDHFFKGCVGFTWQGKGSGGAAVVASKGLGLSHTGYTWLQMALK